MGKWAKKYLNWFFKVKDGGEFKYWYDLFTMTGFSFHTYVYHSKYF